MFARREKDDEERTEKNSEKRPSIRAHKLTSLIAEDVHIPGNVYFSSGIRIDGRVSGNLIGRAVKGQPLELLVLSEKGCIKGTVHCGNAVINGTLVGDMDIGHCLHLQSQSSVSGSIRYRHLQMDVGASARGRLSKADDDALDAGAADAAEPIELVAHPTAGAGTAAL